MKKIEAIIKPFKLDEVRDRIREAGVTGLTVDEVRGFGCAGALADAFGGSTQAVKLVPEVRIELVVADALAGVVIEAIAIASRTGKAGDGKVFVTSVEDAVRIRTGERGDEAV